MKAQEFINPQLEENLRKWFKEKWVRFGPDGKIRGDCARGSDSEGKPKCLPQSKAQALGQKGRASAAARKRRQDPNPERSGKAINVNTKKKSNEGVAEGFLAEETLDDYLASLKNSGAKIIGRGNNAMVFTNPEDDSTVIKVMHQPDPAYLAYLRQSSKHPNNPWFPRVLDINSRAFDTANQRSGTTAWIIVLERLRPASGAEVKNAVDTVLATVNPRYLGTKSPDAYRTFDDIKKPQWQAIAQHSSDADIRVFAEFLSQFAPQNIDVSNANVMMRGSQLVFADPVLS